jgi:RNA-directed DNA polymerase
VNGVLDWDIRGFFDALAHEWRWKFVEPRLADRRVVRLIQKGWNAGGWEEGKRTRAEEGTPQGGRASPLLANVDLPYGFDLWAQAWRQKQAGGDGIIGRLADDIVGGFQTKSEAVRFWAERIESMRKFSRERHPEKTRGLEFGPFAAENRKKRGDGKPETFHFLGFTHIGGKKRSKGRFTVRRPTIGKRWQAKLSEVKIERKRRMQDPIPDVGPGLRSVVGGPMR